MYFDNLIPKALINVKCCANAPLGNAVAVLSQHVKFDFNVSKFFLPSPTWCR
jgi:hypothetical protein